MGFPTSEKRDEDFYHKKNIIKYCSVPDIVIISDNKSPSKEASKEGTITKRLSFSRFILLLSRPFTLPRCRHFHSQSFCPFSSALEFFHRRPPSPSLRYKKDTPFQRSNAYIHNGSIVESLPSEYRHIIIIIIHPHSFRFLAMTAKKKSTTKSTTKLTSKSTTRAITMAKLLCK